MQCGCRLIASEPSNKTLTPTVREWNVFVVTPTSTGWHGGQRALGCCGIALAQAKREPFVSEKRRGARVLA
jgi:hypothetical protein